MIVEEIRTNNEIRGMKWLENMLLDQVTRKDMLEPYHSTTSADFIITIPAQLHVRTARRKYCPDLENQNGTGEACQDLNVVTGTFLRKNLYIPV
ncbi:hypothetical protein Tco_0394227 [Tanacetum coccineum]